MATAGLEAVVPQAFLASNPENTGGGELATTVLLTCPTGSEASLALYVPADAIGNLVPTSAVPDIHHPLWQTAPLRLWPGRTMAVPLPWRYVVASVIVFSAALELFAGQLLPGKFGNDDAAVNGTQVLSVELVSMAPELIESAPAPATESAIAAMPEASEAEAPPAAEPSAADELPQTPPPVPVSQPVAEQSTAPTGPVSPPSPDPPPPDPPPVKAASPAPPAVTEPPVDLAAQLMPVPPPVASNLPEISLPPQLPAPPVAEMPQKAPVPKARPEKARRVATVARDMTSLDSAPRSTRAKPAIRKGKKSASSSLASQAPRASSARAMRDYLGRVRKAVLARVPRKGLAGRYVVSFTIGPGGRSSAISVSGPDAAGRARLATVVRGWFPKPPAGAVRVKVPVTFKSGGS